MLLRSTVKQVVKVDELVREHSFTLISSEIPATLVTTLLEFRNRGDSVFLCRN